MRFEIDTETIDFSSDFVWLDDYAFDGEKAMLEARGALDKLVLIDLLANPDQFRDIATGKGEWITE